MAYPSIEAAVLFTPPTPALRYLPEGPRYLPPGFMAGGDAVLAWVGIQHGASRQQGSLNLFNLKTRTNQSLSLPGRPGFIARTDRTGHVLVGLERELVVLDLHGPAPAPALQRTGLCIEPHARTLINDGVATPFGLVFGTKDVLFRDPLAHLYLYRNGAERLVTLAAGQTCSNGKVVLPGPAGWTLLDIDTPTRRVLRYTLDPEDGRCSTPTVFADLSDTGAFPDGMCLTPDGRAVVVALYDPGDAPFGRALMLALDTGAVRCEWRTPHAPRVTCPAFVVLDGALRLVLTTATEGMTADQLQRHALAGSLFVAEVPFEGPLPLTPEVPLAGLPRRPT